MKIHVYGVKNEEKEPLQRLSAQLGAELVLSEELPSPNSAYDAEGCEGVCVSGEGKVDRLILRCWKNIGVKAVAIRTEAHGHVDLEAAREAGLRVCGASVSAVSEAEYALLLTLAGLRRLPEGVFAGRNLNGKTACVLGDPETAALVVPLLEAFGCHVAGKEEPTEAEEAGEAPKAPESGPVSRLFSLFSPKEEAPAQEAPSAAPCDLVLLLGPCAGGDAPTPDRAFFEGLAGSTVLVSVLAEDRIDLPALVQAIENGRISALGMDLAAPKQSYLPIQAALSPEREEALKKLRRMDRVFLTENLARRTEDAAMEACRSALEGLIALVEGKDCATKLL